MQVLQYGVGLSTDTDSELIAQLLSRALAERSATDDADMMDDISQEIVKVMNMLELSYSLLIMTATAMYAVRDVYGNRPLSIGRLNGDDGGEYHTSPASRPCRSRR